MNVGRRFAAALLTAALSIGAVSFTAGPAAARDTTWPAISSQTSQPSADTTWPTVSSQTSLKDTTWPV